MATRKPNAAYLKKEPSETHKAFSEFIEKTTGHLVPTGDVALVQRLYPLYLKSPAVVKAREAEQAEKDRIAKEKADAKEARLKERLAALEAQRQKVLKELGIATDDVLAKGISLSLVPDEAEPEVEPEADTPTTLVLGESDDEFVEVTPDSDDDDWGDDNDGEDDF